MKVQNEPILTMYTMNLEALWIFAKNVFTPSLAMQRETKYLSKKSQITGEQFKHGALQSMGEKKNSQTTEHFHCLIKKKMSPLWHKIVTSMTRHLTRWKQKFSSLKTKIARYMDNITSCYGGPL